MLLGRAMRRVFFDKRSQERLIICFPLTIDPQQVMG